MLLVLATILPIFALIGAGYAFGRLRGVTADGVALLNHFVVWLALPALLFQALAEADWRALAQPGFIAAFMGGCAITFIIALLWPSPGKRLARRSIDALATSYSNAAYLGIPLALSLFGPAAMPPLILGSVAVVSALFAASITLVEYDLSPAGGVAATLGRVLTSLARNPLIAAPLAGALWAATGLALPKPIHGFVALLAAATSPTALVTIGMFLALPQPAVAALTGLWRALALKLLVQPAVTAFLALYVFAMPPIWSATAILLSALPTGTGPFMVAQLYRQDVAFASRVILLSTLLSIVTVSVVAALLHP